MSIGLVRRSRSGHHDRRGFDTAINISMILIPINFLVLVLYEWKLGLALSLCNAVTFIVLEAASAPPANSPRAFERYSRMQGRRWPVLVCCGDSNLHGTVSASITPEIVPQLCESLGMEPPSPRYATFNAPLWVINCAQNSLSSQTVLQERMSTALNCHPDYILVMIGTNDVLCMYHGEKSLVTKYICSVNQLDTAGQLPTMKSLERNISGILNHIYQASPRVQIGLATLPPMGENLTSPANQLVRQANEVIERAAASFAGPKENISIIPVYSSLEAILEKSKTNRRKTANYFVPILIWMCYMFYIPIFTGWMTWNKLATVVGNTVMSDGIHFSEKGRDVIVELIVDWLNKKNIAKAIAVKSM